MAMLSANLSCRLKAPSHSGSNSMCCPVCLLTASIPWNYNPTHSMNYRFLSQASLYRLILRSELFMPTVDMIIRKSSDRAFLTSIYFRSCSKALSPFRKLVRSWSFHSSGVGLATNAYLLCHVKMRKYAFMSIIINVKPLWNKHSQTRVYILSE